MASDTDTSAQTEEAADEPKKETVGSFLRFLLILFVVTILVRSLIFAPFTIPSGSMLPSLLIGDYLFVAKWPYGYSRYSFPFGIVQFDGRIMESLPERGDIVVFRYPGQRNEDFVKRVIALPGDTVELRGGAVVLNGQPLGRERIADFVMPVSENSPCRPRPGTETRLTIAPDGTRACAYPRYRETLPGGRSFEVLDQANVPGTRSVADEVESGADNVTPFMVPEGHVFVMGDNRDDSLDGRFPTAIGGVGMLPIENIQGRAMINFFSTDGSAEWLLPWTWFTAARWDRIGHTYP
jgi:signal peptidase I